MVNCDGICNFSDDSDGEYCHYSTLNISNSEDLKNSLLEILLNSSNLYQLLVFGNTDSLPFLNTPVRLSSELHQASTNISSLLH